MGADFCYAIIPMCELNEARMKEAKDHVNSAELASAADEHWCETEEEFKERVVKALDDYPMVSARRDTAQLCLNNRDCRYLITGGMSWGDPPTEACDTINVIEQAGLWEAFLRWAKEDVTALKPKTE